jgi:hypothetical protein
MTIPRIRTLTSQEMIQARIFIKDFMKRKIDTLRRRTLLIQLRKKMNLNCAHFNLIRPLDSTRLVLVEGQSRIKSRVNLIQIITQLIPQELFFLKDLLTNSIKSKFNLQRRLNKVSNRLKTRMINK